MRQIADRVIARSGEIEEMLDYMYRQLGQLEIVAVDNLPETVVPSKALLNRSLDVKSAALLYLSVHIRHEGNGIIGTARSILRSLPFKATLERRFSKETQSATHPELDWRKQFGSSIPRSPISVTA
jgi:hypothetical protein